MDNLRRSLLRVARLRASRSGGTKRALRLDTGSNKSHEVEVRRLLLNPSFGEQLRELTRSNNIVSRSVTKQSPGALPVEPVKASEA
jgi:hypothetical protein